MTTRSAWANVPTSATEPDRDAEVRQVLASRGRADQPAAVAHLSLLGTDSCVGAYDPREGITPLVELRPLPLRGLALLDDIEAVDENAAKLVATFMSTFPDVRQRLTSVGADLGNLDTPALGWLLLAARVLISLEDDDAPEPLLGENVLLDTVVIEQDGRYVFDGRRLLRSLMSYRLADVPAPVLARSVSQSLGEFVSGALARLVQDWPDARSVACAGDVFASDVLLAAWTRQGLARLGRPVAMPR